MNSCERTRELLALKIDTVLPEQDERALAEHLESCDDCVAIAGWLGEVDELAAAADEREPTQMHFEKIAVGAMDSIRQQARPEHGGTAGKGWSRLSRAWLPRLAPMAAIVAVLAVFTLRQDQDSPIVVPEFVSEPVNSVAEAEADILEEASSPEPSSEPSSEISPEKVAAPRALASAPIRDEDDAAGASSADRVTLGRGLIEESFRRFGEVDEIASEQSAPVAAKLQTPVTEVAEAADAAVATPSIQSLWRAAELDTAPQPLTRLLLALEAAVPERRVLGENEFKSGDREDAPVARLLEQRMTPLSATRERDQLQLSATEDSLRAFLRVRAGDVADPQLRVRLLRLAVSQHTLLPDAEESEPDRE